ncbi:hypothetical protein [Pseudomonas sp. P1.8]|uniref:hypothetical protein n=1 Tax=Pseudomonas sp. P1.8 TaxID=1699310 RepID=UPI000B1AB7EE|nr:hypothetical protein [Pseudomonas sp. P1.8]
MEKPQVPSHTEVVTLSQLADLAGLDRTFFSEHRHELPTTLPIHDGNQGRPQLCYPLDQLAEFICTRVGFLSEVEARLRLALAPAVYRKRKSPMARFLDAYSLLEVDGVLEVVPRDHSLLTPELSAKVRALIAQEHANARARRSAKARRTRSPTQTTPEEVPQR